MRNVQKLTAVTAYFGVLAAGALGNGMEPLFCATSDVREQNTARQRLATVGGQRWLVLNEGLGREGYPILYRVDGGVLFELTNRP